jgi:all-trans-retinol 13,14-reductase
MTHSSKQNNKALVIGAGIGGLSMAIILSKLGYDVTVVEKNRQPGGMLRSYVRRGIHCNVGVHYLGALGRGQVLWRLLDYLGIADALPLQQMGVDGPVDRYCFTRTGDGPKQFDLPAGFDAYADHLKAAFPKEQAAIEGFMQLLRQGAHALDRLDFLFGKPTTADFIDQTEPLWAVLDRLGCSPGLKSVLGVPSVWFGVPPAQCPLFYHTMTLASYLLSAWRIDGPGTLLADALANRLRDLGGKIICGRPVRRIDLRQGRVAGLLLEDGQAHAAPLVIGTAHPASVMEMVDPGQVKPSYRKRMMRLENTGGMFAVHAAVPAASHPPMPYNLFAMQAEDDGTIRDVIYTQLRPGPAPETLVFSLITRGYDALWRPWQATASGQRGKAYIREKTALARRLIEAVRPLTGALNGLEIIDTFTPLTLRDWVNTPGGSAYGVMKSHQQMLSAALLNRTSVKGLYLAGQSVMAPGILGTILGSLATTKFIVGTERFNQEVRL